MARLDAWNGEENNNCICRYCTPGIRAETFYEDEPCPSCREGLLSPSLRFPDWLSCSSCGFECRDGSLVEEEAEAQARSEKSEGGS